MDGQPSLGPGGSNPQWSKIPPIGADPKDLRQFVDGGIYYRNRLRAIDWSNWRRAELYDGGWQHLKGAPTTFDGPGTYSQWVRKIADPNSADYIPLPVINLGQGVRANESARLGRPNYRPVPRPRTDTLEARLGAQNARDLLESRLREMNWPAQAQMFYYHIPLYGGAWVKSQWELRWDKTTMKPIQGAVACANHSPTDPSTCQSRLASPVVPQGALQAPDNALSPAAPDAQGRPQVTVNACPTCPDHPPMLPFQPNMDEANSGKDMLGRPLGESAPIGDWELSVLSPYNVFPRNLGLDQRSGDIREWTEVHVENMDWLSLRYPEKLKDVKPESPTMLSQVHPVAGAPDMYASMDTALFKDCVRIKERHKAPWMELSQDGTSVSMNKGRSVVMAGDTVLMDGPLMIDSLNNPGEIMPRVMVDYVAWELRDGGRRLSGLGVWELLFDVQDGLNECISQEQAIRQRMAVPFYVVSKAHNFEISAMSDGIPGRLAEIDPDPIAPNMLPQVINNQTAPPGIEREAEFYSTSMDRLGNQAAVEKGDVPPNVSAALAIQSLKNYASETREGRFERIKITLKRVWNHGLQLMAGMYIEPRPVRTLDDDGEERWKALHGSDLKGQTEIEIEADPDFDEKAKNQELVNQFIQNKLLDVTSMTPAQKRKVIQSVYEGPKELTEVDDLQVDAAQREWVEFREKGTIPIIDPALNDPVIHGDEHAKSMNTDFFRDLCEKAEWRTKVLPILEPLWDQSIQQAAAMPAIPMAPTGGAMPGIDPATGMQTLVPQMAPAGPPISLQQRIVQVWTQTLGMVQQMVNPMGQPSASTSISADPDTLQKVMQFYAHYEAHKKEAEMRQAAVQMGQVVAAQPGTENVGGMQPTTQQTMMQDQTPTQGVTPA